MSERESSHQVDLLLKQLADAFLADLLEYCDKAEADLLLLEQNFTLNVFNRLFGLIHSIKGSGGTHGFPIISSIGHQFESVLVEWQETRSKKALPILLNYVDLLRQTTAYLSTGADLAPLKQKLEHLRLGVNQTAKRLLLVESSRIMRQLCQEVLSDLGVQLDTYDDGLKALNELLHTRYDCLIIGRQLNSLNGPAVVAALRESDSVNQNIPVLMISTDERQLPEHLKILRLLPRTPALSDVLVIEMEKLMKKRPQIEERSLG